MEHNQYKYEQYGPWATPPQGYDPNYQGWYPNQQQQGYSPNYQRIYPNQQPGALQALKLQAPPAPKAQVKSATPARMPKARAVALASLFKKSLVVLSLATFASFSGLVAYHQVQTSTSQESTSTTSSHTQQSNKNFLQQQGGNNLGTSTPTATNTNQPAATATANSGSPSGSDPSVSSGPFSSSHTS